MKGKVRFQGNQNNRRNRRLVEAGTSALEEKVSGVISIARSGTGFVSPDGGGDDVMVPEEDVGQAFHGDRVSIRMMLTPRKWLSKLPDPWALKQGRRKLSLHCLNPI